MFYAVCDKPIFVFNLNKMVLRAEIRVFVRLASEIKISNSWPLVFAKKMMAKKQLICGDIMTKYLLIPGWSGSFMTRRVHLLQIVRQRKGWVSRTGTDFFIGSLSGSEPEVRESYLRAYNRMLIEDIKKHNGHDVGFDPVRIKYFYT